MSMGLGNVFLDSLVECECEHDHHIAEGTDCVIEGIDGDFIVLPTQVTALLTEALNKDQLENAWRKMQRLHKSDWASTGRSRKQLVAMAKDQRFLDHGDHVKRLIDGGVSSDGQTFSGGGGIRWGGLLSSKGQVLMRTRGSFEYGPSQNQYQQTLGFQNFDKIIAAKDITWIDKARLLLRDRLRVHCDCPAYRYFYAAAATTKGFALYPELRPASIKNPKKKGGICKHLHLTLQWLGTHNAALGKELRQWKAGP